MGAISSSKESRLAAARSTLEGADLFETAALAPAEQAGMVVAARIHAAETLLAQSRCREEPGHRSRVRAQAWQADCIDRGVPRALTLDRLVEHEVFGEVSGGTWNDCAAHVPGERHGGTVSVQTPSVVAARSDPERHGHVSGAAR
jgi:hypothetical protein